MSKRQGRSFWDDLKTRAKKPFKTWEKTPKTTSPEQGEVSGTSGTVAADVAGCSGTSQQAHLDQELFKVDSIEKILKMDKDFKCACESSGKAASEILSHLGMVAAKEGLTDYNFMETPSLWDLSEKQKNFLTLCGECFFCCSVEWRRELFPAFLSSVQGVLLINSSQLHIIANEHLLKTTTAFKYIFFSDDEDSEHPEKKYNDLITIVEDLNAVLVCCSGEKKASEFLKKHKFRPVNEFFLKKEKSTHLYFSRIGSFNDGLPTKMLKELIAVPEAAAQKNRKQNAVHSSEQENTTGLRLTKNSDIISYSNHCLSMVWYIYAINVDRSGMEILTDVLSLVTAPRVIRVVGKDGDACDAELTKNLVKKINFPNRLEELTLVNINLTANAAAFIAESLYKVPNLYCLDLSSNSLLGEGVSFVAERLSSVPDLESLELNNVKMTRTQVRDLSTAVRQSKISVLSSNYHDDEGNTKPEYQWPSEYHWKRMYPSLFPDSSSELEDKQQQGHSSSESSSESENQHGRDGLEERVHHDGKVFYTDHSKYY